MGNAVKVTTRTNDSTGGNPFFFGRVFGLTSFTLKASAVAMANPRDIAFVVDLSGSMNDDTEPCWATGDINTTFGSHSGAAQTGDTTAAIDGCGAASLTKPDKGKKGKSKCKKRKKRATKKKCRKKKKKR